MKYVDGKKNEIEFLAKGEGGLEELKSHLKDNEIRFGVLQTIVTGSEVVAGNSLSFLR